MTRLIRIYMIQLMDSTFLPSIPRNLFENKVFITFFGLNWVDMMRFIVR